MNYLPTILAVAGIHLLAVMSPGPDFVLITKNSLVHSRRSGFFTSLGLGLGIATHVAYCLAGIGLIISESIILFNIIKLIGAAYLLFIGVQALRSKKSEQSAALEQKQTLSDWQSFRTGYIANVTNPKATLFMLSLFTLVISATTPLGIKLVMGLEMTLVTVLWFTLVSFVLSHRLVRERFLKVQHRVEQIMGAALVVLGLKVAFSHSK